MKELAYLNPYLLKYKWQLMLGVLFIVISNLFAVYSPKIIQQSFDLINEALKSKATISDGNSISLSLPFIIEWFYNFFDISKDNFVGISNEDGLFKQIGVLTITLAIAYLLLATT